MAPRRHHTPLSDESYQALVRSETDLTPRPWALERVRYLSAGGTRRLALVFLDPSVSPLAVDLATIPELAQASDSDLFELRLSPARDTIILEALDVHLSVEGLITAATGRAAGNADFVTSHNAFVERHGLPLARHRIADLLVMPGVADIELDSPRHAELARPADDLS